MPIDQLPGTRTGFDRALDELRAGHAAVVHGCAGGGGIVFAASRADVARTAFAVRHSSGLLCVALPAQRCDQLGLPPMHPRANHPAGAVACVTVDASLGVTTGISAADRARAARVLADPDAVGGDLRRPGHLVPVAVGDAALRGQPGLAEAALELVSLSGRSPAAVYAHLVSPVDETRMASDPELRDFAADHGIADAGVGEIAARTT